MVVIRAARTLPVNPAEAAPVITHDQLWHALQRKIRYATEFVPAIQHCKVVSDKGEEVVRDCVLVHASGERRYMRETVTSHGKQWVCHVGSRLNVSNQSSGRYSSHKKIAR